MFDDSPHTPSPYDPQSPERVEMIPLESVEQIDRAYGHLLPDALERTRSALDAFLKVEDAGASAGEQT